MGFVLGKALFGGKLIGRGFTQPTRHTQSGHLLLAVLSLDSAPVENYGASSCSFEALLSASANQPRRSCS